MILKQIETVEVKRWDKVDDYKDGILLTITTSTHWYSYKLNEREEELFKRGLNPEEILLISELDMEPKIFVTKWDIYA